MTVYRRKNEPGEPWYYDFWTGGVRHQGYCLDPDTGKPAKNEGEANDIQAVIRRAAKAKQGIERSGLRPGSFTIAQAMLLHIDGQVDSTPEHVANLKMYSREILAFFKPETPVIKIPQQRIEAYRKFAAEQHVKIWIGGGDKRRDRTDPKNWKRGDRLRSPASVNHYLDCLRGALTAAHNVKDPVTGNPMLPFPPAVKPLAAPKRLPDVMPDGELKARVKVAAPWTKDGVELARAFGLRMDETARVTVHHIDHEQRCLRFKGETQKSNRDEHVYGGEPGYDLLLRLAEQARSRGQIHLITWPGPEHVWNAKRGREIPQDAWRPLQSVRKSWATTAKDAGIERPHRFHDVRGAYITQIAEKTESALLIRLAARHQDQATTDRYIDIARRKTAQAVKKAMGRGKLAVVKGGKS